MRFSDVLALGAAGWGVPQRGHTAAFASMTSRQEKQTFALGKTGVVMAIS
jgi:hypothetical protein